MVTIVERWCCKEVTIVERQLLYRGDCYRELAVVERLNTWLI